MKTFAICHFLSNVNKTKALKIDGFDVTPATGYVRPITIALPKPSWSVYIRLDDPKFGGAVRPAILILVVLFVTGQAALAVHTVEKSVDASLLPYQLRTQGVISFTNAGYFEPMPIKGQERPGAWEVGENWRGDTLSFIIFYRDLLTGGAINQVNRRTWAFMSEIAGDPDGDGDQEIIVTYLQDDEVWLEIFEIGGETVYKRSLGSFPDNNRNGRWEGTAQVRVVEDFNGDGRGELLLTTFSGFDLLPRNYSCLDWYGDSVLWVYDISGLPGDPRIIKDASGQAGRVAFEVASMGNAVSTGTMDDQHSYLICLDISGNELWTHVLGGVFSRVEMVPYDTDNDGVSELVTCSSFGESDSTGEAGSLIRVTSTTGLLLDTLRLPRGPVVRQLTIGDLDADGRDEILICTSDGLVIVYDANLTERSRHQFEAEVSIWKTTDFVGNGEHQLMASTVDGMTFLLDQDFDLLAQYEGLFTYRSSHILEADLSPVGTAMLLRDEDDTRSLVMYFEKQPFLTILTTFMVRNQGTFLAVLGVLAAALVATNYHRRRIRRNLELISRQRDELEKTRNELQKAMEELVAAQTRLVQSEKMASLGMLVAGIAHEINNALGSLTSNNNTAFRVLGRLRQRIGDVDIDEQPATDMIKMLELVEASCRSTGEGADTIARIVRQLRSFARLDEAEWQRVTVHECLDETIGLLHATLKQNILVTKEYGDLPKIACYPSQLNQAFLNILTNAREAISGRGEITVHTSTKDGMVVISISDTGAGIPPDRLEKIFDPGYTTRGVGVGTGLGLAICYQIIHDHGGDILVESEVGRGSKFTVRLPLTAGKRDAAH